MSFYYTGTATGPGAAAAFFSALNTNLLAGSWTAHDVIGATDVIYKGGSLDATAGNAPFVRVTVTSTTAIDFQVYQDWDATTHTGINTVGNATGTTRLTVTDASFVYWMRINPLAFFVCIKNSTNYNKAYAGFLRRGLGLTRSGCTKTTGTHAAAATVLNVASDMTAKIKVGQTISIANYAHASGNANAAKWEKKTVLSLTASTITLTAGLTNAYDAGALVGENVLPVCVCTVNTSGNTAMNSGNMYFPTDIDGTRTSATAHTLIPAETALNSLSNNAPSSGWGTYGSGVYDLTTSTSTKTGIRGFFYHVHAFLKGAQSVEDVMTDGDNNFVVLGIGTNIVTAIGPQN